MENVVEKIAESDRMFDTREHYFSVGRSAFKIIQIALLMAGNRDPKSVLDFGCGCGRVTRWLRAGFPKAQLAACDVDFDAEFVQATFDATTWRCSREIPNLKSPSVYDLIWVGSVLTHLNEPNCENILRTLLSWLNSNGLLVVTLHGRECRKHPMRYGIGHSWDGIILDCDRVGFGYSDYQGQSGYGISLCSPSWAIDVAQRIGARRIVLYGEALWDNHQDVIVLQSQ